MAALELFYEICGFGGGGFYESDAPWRSAEDLFTRKYRHRRGRSGRSYAFAAYAPLACPAYMDAVLLVASRSRETPLACVDLGAWPEAALDRMRRRFATRLGEVEFQIHVLAESEGERRALIEDVSG